MLLCELTILINTPYQPKHWKTIVLFIHCLALVWHHCYNLGSVCWFVWLFVCQQWIWQHCGCYGSLVGHQKSRDSTTLQKLLQTICLTWQLFKAVKTMGVTVMLFLISITIAHQFQLSFIANNSTPLFYKQRVCLSELFTDDHQTW